MTTLSSCLDLLAVDLGVGASRCGGNAAPATPTAGSPRRAPFSSVRIVDAASWYCVGVLHQRVHAPAGGVAGGLVAGHRQQQHEERRTPLPQPVAVDLGVDQLGDDVIARIRLALLRQLIDVDVELAPTRLMLSSVRVLGVVDPDHAVGPVEEQLAVLLRHPHDLGDRLQRQLSGEIGDEVAGAALDDLVDDQRRPVGGGTAPAGRSSAG